MNINFESLLLNESFIEKISNEGVEAEHYVKELLQLYPDKTEEILMAAQFVLLSKRNYKELRGADTALIWDNIQKTKNVNKQPFLREKRPAFPYIWRAAAVIIVLIGFGYYVHTQNQPNSFRRIAQTAEVSNDKARIILSDGTEHKLENNESSISYVQEGEEILITEYGNHAEKIDNTKNNKQGVPNQIIVPYGRRHRVTLCDGTVVQLNSGSKLVFPASFTENSRKVYLVGEGFFEVAKDKNKPFIVSTDYIDIKVTGTVFNISAYANEPEVSAVLVEGSVQVSQKNKIIGNTKYDLVPGQGCFYSVEAEQSSVSKVDVSNYIGWKDGWIQFKDQPLINIVRKVEKYYNKNIVIEGQDLANTLISGKLILSEQFEDALAYITKTLEGSYEVNNQEIYIIKEETKN